MTPIKGPFPFMPMDDAVPMTKAETFMRRQEGRMMNVPELGIELIRHITKYARVDGECVVPYKAVYFGGALGGGMGPPSPRRLVP